MDNLYFSLVRDRRTSRLGISAYDRHRCIGTLPNVDLPETKPPPLLTFMSRSKILALNGLNPQMEPLYSDPLPGMEIGVSSPSPSEFRRHEPIYATLSETQSSSNTLDFSMPNQDQCHLHNEFECKEDEDEEEGSATESAGDDFEFHNVRSSRQTLIVHDAVMENIKDLSPPMTLLDMKPRSKIARSATYRILCNGLDVTCAKRAKKDDAQSQLTATSESQHGIVTCVTFQVKLPLADFTYIVHLAGRN